MPLIKLSSKALERRAILPEKPAPVSLVGRTVCLEPLIIVRDAKPLFEVSNGSPISVGERSIGRYDADALIWRYLFEGPFNDENSFEKYLDPYVHSPNGLCLCVIDKASNQQIGVVNFMNNVPNHLKIELGGIWYTPLFQGTVASTEATYLMLKHAFELGYRRVEWKCHADNERSRRAALRMGFAFEGIQESHMISKECNRDTAWYRILEEEWPEVQAKLEQVCASG